MPARFLGLAYRRPAQQPISITLPEKDESQTDLSLKSTASPLAGIPDALAFDRIMDGGTCPPCTVRDFMNYLIYIEHSAENLQFLLWYRSYLERFPKANTADLDLAPEWTQEMQDDAFAQLQQEHRAGMKRDPAHVAALFKGTDFDKNSKKNSSAGGFPSSFGDDTGGDPFATPPQTAWSSGDVSTPGSTTFTYRKEASDAFAAHDIKAPFTIQPFREEINRVIATYITPGSPRQLNLSARERKQLLIALSHTTHPTAFRQVSWSVESSLRMQSHPNFIRWSICNGNPSRVAFANILGAVLIIGSLAAYLALCLSASVPRGLRAVPAVGMVLGVSTQIAAWKGMCVVLHGMHHRHVRPWELFVDEEVELRDTGSASEKGAPNNKESFESFGSGNSYEDEPWVVKYEKRNLVRKVFDREVWIKEPALRTIQDTIFVQAMLGAIITAGVLTVIFVCVPVVHL